MDLAKITQKPAHPHNFMVGRGGHEPDMLVLHVLEAKRVNGKYEYFEHQHDDRKVSAHFIVYQDGSLIQYVKLKDTAYHCKGWNQHSIGIEMEGLTKDPKNFTDAMMKTLADLVATLCKKYGIALDRKHIVGHDELHKGNSDPGKYFDWKKLMELVNQDAKEEPRV